MKFSFESGGYILEGKIDVGYGNKFIFYVPGINFNLDKIDWLSNFLTREGYNFVRFELKYHKKENNLENFNIESDLEDINNAIKFIEENGYNVQNIGIISKSFGGIKGFLLDNKKINSHCFIAPASFFENNNNIENISKKPYNQIESLKDIKLDKNILENWNIPSIILHGDKDDVVDISNSEKISDKISYLELVKIEGMGHAIETQKEKDIIGKNIVDFFNKNI